MKAIKGALAIAVLMIVTFCPQIRAQKAALSEQDVREAIVAGQKKPGLGNPLWWKVGVTLIQFSHQDDWMDLYVYTPVEWIKLESRLASANLKPYEPSQDDLAPVLRVVVITGTDDLRFHCSQISNIVLRDVKKSMIVQPISYTPASEDYQNLFGATQMCKGAIATFSMDDLAKVRSMDAKKEFLISTAAEGETPTDHKIKEREFPRLD